MAGKSAAVTLPILALCCVGTILAAIAITIVLALIPLYTNTTPVTLADIHATSRSFTQTSEIDGSMPIGTLNDESKAKILSVAKQAMSNLDKSSVDIAANSAAISEPTDGRRRRRRHAGGKHILTVEYTVYARNRALLEAFIKKLRAFIAVNHDLFASAVAALTITTISPDAISTTVATGAVSASVTTAVSATASVSANPTAVGRRRRYNEGATIPSPLVTYQD